MEQKSQSKVLYAVPSNTLQLQIQRHRARMSHVNFFKFLFAEKMRSVALVVHFEQLVITILEINFTWDPCHCQEEVAIILPD